MIRNLLNTEHLTTVAALYKLIAGICTLTQPCISEELDVRVDVRGSLMVPRGRSRYLSSEDLPVGDFILPNTTCKIRVVNDDPSSLLVGSVQPEVFDCSWKPNTVFYQHDGNPLLGRDTVRMMVLVFHDNHPSTVSTIYCQLDVQVIDAPYNIFTTAVPGEAPVASIGLRPLRVSIANGLSDVISHSNFTFAYKSQDEGENCRVGMLSGKRFPSRGNVTASSARLLQQFLNGTLDCQEFLLAGIRYKHSGVGSPDRDFIPLLVERESVVPLEDEVSISREFVYLPIEIASAARNSPPTIMVSKSSIPVSVEAYSTIVLSSMILSAFDDETRDEFLFFNITSEVLPGMYGYFTLTNDNSRKLRSFSQQDVIDGRISYHPPTSAVQHETDITFEIVAFDNFFEESEKAKLTFRCVPSKSALPKIFTESEFFVAAGSEQALLPIYLRLENTQNVEAIEFEVEEGLKYGSLKINNQKISQFSGRDLKDGSVFYAHDGVDLKQDEILFKIIEGRHRSRVKFIAKIIPVHNSSPYLSTNMPLLINSGGFQQITTKNLEAQDRDTILPDNIVYHLVKQPQSGEIVYRHHPLTRGRRVQIFTQKDIQMGFIYYQHLGDLRDESDLVEFYLQNKDETRNKSGLYKLDINIRSINNMSPHPSEESSRQITVENIEPFTITKEIIQYEDVNENSESLTYHITKQPYFVNSARALNAGYLAITSTSGKEYIGKDGENFLQNFVQKDINLGHVAYISPRQNIGLGIHHVRFRFAVCDSELSCNMDQLFDVMLLGANRTSSPLLTESLLVEPTGTVKLTAHNILTYDPFTGNERIILILTKSPSLGYLVKNNEKLSQGDSFSLEELSSADIRLKPLFWTFTRYAKNLTIKSVNLNNPFEI